jgi:hypothetical protein
MNDLESALLALCLGFVFAAMFAPVLSHIGQ